MHIRKFCCTFAVDMRKILLVIVFIIGTYTLWGQTHHSADKLFQAGDYAGAQESYRALLKNYPTNPLYLYRYARCAQEQGDDTTAIKYFQKAGDKYILKYFYMAESYMRLWHMDKAIESYSTYLNSLKEPNEREAHVHLQIATAEKIQRYLRRVEQLQVIDYVEVALDSMLEICALSADAGNLTMDATHNIIYTNQRGDRQLHSTQVDSTYLLVTTHRLLDEWTTPDTLPETINFTPEQRSPYLLNDGITLYFAANDTNGLGGLDIYISRYNMATESYTTPENLGMPYNSPANEYFFVLDEIHHIGYLATDRFADTGRVHVYSFLIPEQKQYWRNIPTDSLVAYARLEQFEKANIMTTNDSSTVDILEKNTDEIGDFCFIINDSTIYYSLDDFQQQAARDKYNEWSKLDKQIHTEQQSLAQLRKQYAAADEATKKELTPVILQLENNQSQLRIQSEQLLQSIRNIEITSFQE